MRSVFQITALQNLPPLSISNKINTCHGLIQLMLSCSFNWIMWKPQIYIPTQCKHPNATCYLSDLCCKIWIVEFIQCKILDLLLWEFCTYLLQIIFFFQLDFFMKQIGVFMDFPGIIEDYMNLTDRVNMTWAWYQMVSISVFCLLNNHPFLLIEWKNVTFASTLSEMNFTYTALHILALPYSHSV